MCAEQITGRTQNTAEWQDSRIEAGHLLELQLSLGVVVTALMRLPEGLQDRQSATLPRKGTELPPESGDKCSAHFGWWNSGKKLVRW